jgi:hypothetical protein
MNLQDLRVGTRLWLAVGLFIGVLALEQNVKGVRRVSGTTM